MGRRRRRLICSGILPLIFFVTLFINFFHTETGLSSDRECPACHFQGSSLAIGLSPAVTLPQLWLVETVPELEPKLIVAAVFFDLFSRPPPVV